MARNEQEIEILPLGTKADSPEHGPFIQNMIRKQNAWETRPGWGQIGQFDSCWGQSRGPHGYTTIVGSYIFKTDFGHTQIVTVLALTAFTGETLQRGIWTQTYAVQIYDVTTRRNWEEILHRHTSEQDPNTTSPQTYRGAFESNYDQDFSSFPSITGPVPQRIWMIEYQDTVYFGSKTMGVWSYTPCDFSGNGNTAANASSPGNWQQQLQGTRVQEWAPTYGESPVVRPITPSPGPVQAANAYLDSGGFPSVACTAVIDNRLCYAQQRSVYFTDPGYAGSIQGENILQIPCEDYITAMTEFSGNLIIFTPRETWFYSQNTGNIISNGQLTKISSSVGCPSPYAVVRAGSTIFWLDDRGAYTLKGQFTIQPISDQVKNLFDPTVGMSNPFTSYLTANGRTDTNSQQPKSFMYMDAADAIVAFDNLYKHIYIAQPSQNLCWTYSEGAWAVYSWETVCNNSNTVVAQTVLSNVWVLSQDGVVYGVGGPEAYVPRDEISPAEDQPSSSFYIVKQGHGGSLDRTVAHSEDNRSIAGWFDVQSSNLLFQGYVKMDRPWLAPTSYFFPNNPSGVTAPTYIYPVRIQSIDATYKVDHIDFIFQFDNTQWAPVFTDNTNPYLDLIIPAERSGSKAGYQILSPIPATAEAQCYDSGTSLPSRTGNEIRIRWDATVTNTHSVWTWNKMNLSQVRESLLYYIGFRKINNQLEATMSMGVQTQHARIYRDFAGNHFRNLGSFLWHQAYTPNLHKGDDTAKPIDWVIKSDQIGLDGQDQIKTRGLYVHLVDHSVSLEGIDTSWKFSTFNVLGSGDMADYNAQLKDFSDGTPDGPWKATEHVVTKANIRNLLLDNTGTLQPKVFNNTAATWGAAGTDSGNVLIDNEQYDTRAISSNVRGETVTWMMFGFLRDTGEKIIIDSVKAAIKDTGDRKRRGR